MSTMSIRTLSLRTLLFLGLCQTGRRSLASTPELRDQPKKIGKPVPVDHSPHPKTYIIVVLLITHTFYPSNEI